MNCPNNNHGFDSMMYVRRLDGKPGQWVCDACDKDDVLLFNQKNNETLRVQEVRRGGEGITLQPLPRLG